MQRWLLKTIAFLVIFLICLYSSIWLLTPTIAQFYSSNILKMVLNENELVLSEATTIRYNPFLSHLTIFDLTLTKGNESPETVLIIEQLDLEVSLHRLFIDQIQITEFQINGLFLKVNIDANNVDVAGISLNSLFSNNLAPEKTKNPAEISPALVLKMAKLQLYNANIDININGKQQNIDISALAIERLYANRQEQRFSAFLEVKINDAPLTVSLNSDLNNGLGVITSYTAIRDLDLAHLNQFLPDSLTANSGFLSYKGEQKFTLTEDTTSIAVRQLEFKAERLSLIQEDVQVALAKQTLISDDLHIEFAKDKPAKIMADAVISVEGLSVIYQNQAHILAQFNHFTIEGLLATKLGISIDLATLSGLSIDAQLNEKKLPSSLVEFPIKEQVKAEIKPSIFNLYIGKFNIADDGYINLIDNRVSPHYKRNFIIKKLVVGPFNSQAVETKTLFQIIGNSEEYSHFSFSGFSQPYAAEPVHHIEGVFNEINLPDLSTYIKKALMYVVNSGHLDLSVNTTITGDDIEGEVDMLLRGLALAADDDEINSLNDHSAIPFSIALSMLKDRVGNVHLNIPLSGKTSNPSFGMSGFVKLLIKQATMNAAQEHLIKTFIPYASVISIALTAGDHLLNIRFNDLEFPPSQTVLQPNHNLFLSEFAALLKDRPDENITLCAISTALDINKPAGTDVSSVTDIKKLKAISLARMNAFKRYMVKIKKLSSSRLLLCSPQVDLSLDAKPRITFSN